MIAYKQYKELGNSAFERIAEKNVLFWNMWNVTYAFEILEKFQKEYGAFYMVFKELWEFCWAAIEKKHVEREAFEKIFGKNYPFVFDDDGEIVNPKGLLQIKYGELSDDVLPELCITQLIYRFDAIYQGIVHNEKRFGENAGDTPVEVIALIIGSNDLGLLINNMDLAIVENEVTAQLQLLKDLSDPGKDYTYPQRNIYRNEEAMTSLSYKPF